jgi:hypothetical protein
VKIDANFRCHTILFLKYPKLCNKTPGCYICLACKEEGAYIVSSYRAGYCSVNTSTRQVCLKYQLAILTDLLAIMCV